MSISIHALHEESDFGLYFNFDAESISIHALHEESDRRIAHTIRLCCHFNPRSP